MAWLSDYHYWALALIVALIYFCAEGFDRLTDAVEAFHEDYRKVNSLDARDAIESEWQGP
jgi:hypothetical protein